MNSFFDQCISQRLVQALSILAEHQLEFMRDVSLPTTMLRSFSMGAIGPTEQFMRLMPTIPVMGHNQRWGDSSSPIMLGELRTIVYGMVEYRDAFGVDRWTTLSQSWIVNTKNQRDKLHVSERYNDVGTGGPPLHRAPSNEA